MTRASPFRMVSGFEPTGDQPPAIETLSRGLAEGRRFQVLEGVTGSGKTFTMAHLVARHGRPALVVSHNKTLAAQLYSELKSFFPGNAVEYFVSYYDYYQPEAYIPTTDTYIEKDASINEEIERLRLSATDALLNREDVDHRRLRVLHLRARLAGGLPADGRPRPARRTPGARPGAAQARRHPVRAQRRAARAGTFPRAGATRLDIFPSYAEEGIRIAWFGDEIEALHRFDPLTGRPLAEMEEVTVSPARHFVMPHTKIESALAAIRDELEERVRWFERHDKLLEAQRIRMRTEYDLEMMQEIGYCSGIENYSRHLSGRAGGERPATLIDYFRGDFLTIIDESHVTVPQLRGMYNGDRARKQVLVDHGFRLPSALDNRPLRFEEFLDVTGPMLFVSATPGPYEREVGGEPVPQVIRPTGIVDPPVDVRPLAGPDRRPDGGGARPRRAGRARAGDHAHQAHRRGPGRVPPRRRASA